MLSACCKKIAYQRQDGQCLCTGCNETCHIADEQHNTGVAVGMSNKDRQEGKNLRDRANAWMAKNPHAMKLFIRYALEMYNQKRKFGIGQLTERVRWDNLVSTEGSQFKVSNDYRAYIARKLIEIHPELENYIELRKTKW